MLRCCLSKIQKLWVFLLYQCQKSSVYFVPMHIAVTFDKNNKNVVVTDWREKEENNTWDLRLSQLCTSTQRPTGTWRRVVRDWGFMVCLKALAVTENIVSDVSMISEQGTEKRVAGNSRDITWGQHFRNAPHTHPSKLKVPLAFSCGNHLTWKDRIITPATSTLKMRHDELQRLYTSLLSVLNTFNELHC